MAYEIRDEDINPRFNWARALPALGITAVDFEERVDYRRLHRYRLARVRQALGRSELGALLVFDVNNIRYVTSTKIGEWERDKLSRWALLTRTGEPILWDFGSAAVHHKLHTPWLAPENCRAGGSAEAITMKLVYTKQNLAIMIPVNEITSAPVTTQSPPLHPRKPAHSITASPISAGAGWRAC